MNDSANDILSEGPPARGEVKSNKYLDYLLDNIPKAVRNASVSRVGTFVDQQPPILDWYFAASAIDRNYLQQLISDHWRLEGTLDKTLGDLQKDIRKFAEPLLVEGLKDTLNLELDVNEVQVRLYAPANLIFGIDIGASRLRQCTLLEAALHNFEEPETVEGAFRDGSGIFTKDAEGELVRHPLTVEKFAALCRTLDIGKHYQDHLKARLDPPAADASKALTQQSTASERAMFSEAAMIAYLKKDISWYAYSKLQHIRDGEKEISFNNRLLQSHRLSIVGFRLTGIVLFSAVADSSEIKKIYQALVPEYQRQMLEWSRHFNMAPTNFLEQFKLLKAFFANGPSGVVEETFRNDDIDKQSRLDGRLIVYVPDDPHHPLKEYDSFTDFMKELTSQLRNADYQEFFSRFVAQKDKGLFFTRVEERFSTFTWQQREPLDMGPWWRETAIENPDAEPITNVIAEELWTQLCQWRRVKAIADARYIAVPTDDEDASTRWQRLTSYLSIGWNVFNFGAMLVPGLGEVMLGIMVGQMLLETMEGIEDWSKGDKAAASALLTGVLINSAQLAAMIGIHAIPGAAAASIKPSSFVDQLKKIELPDGKTRLWNPDLRPYEHKVALPKGSTPNEHGLHAHNGQDFLPLDGKHFEVKNDPLTGRPRLRHPERPNTYQPSLQHNGAGAWLTELDRPIEWGGTRLMKRLGHSVEGFDETTLEQIRIASGVEENVLRRLQVESAPPPALLLDSIQRFKAWSDAGKLPEQILANEVPEELVDFLPPFMTELPGWPEQKGIEVFQGREHWGSSITYGELKPAAGHSIKLTRSEIKAGKLPEFVFKSLDEKEIRDLLGQNVGSDEPARIEALRSRLAMVVEKQQKRLFEALNNGRQRSSNPQVLHVQDTFKQLPANVIEELLKKTSPEDLLKLSEKKTIPLTLKEQARAAELEVRVNRAYEKLFRGELDDPDTEKLVTCLLQLLPDVDRASLASGASGRAKLVRIVQRAPLAREQLRPILAEYPLRKPAYDANTMHLRGGMQGYPQLLPDLDALHHRASSLYPAMDAEQVDGLLGSFGFQAEEHLSQLETEFDELNRSFRRWVDSPTQKSVFSEEGRKEWTSRNKVCEALRKCWQRTGPRGTDAVDIVHPQALVLDDLPMGQLLRGMPELKAQSFSHVTSLSVRNGGLGTFDGGFLRAFPKLQSLNLQGNQLMAFPKVISDMKYLDKLNLSDNQILLTEEGSSRLRTMTRLDLLNLNNNPLELAPDISRMPGLRFLLLENTQIKGWPTGLFTQSRPRDFLMSLRGNPLRQIPEVAPGSWRAEMLARTHLNRDQLVEQVRAKLKTYIESVGLDPDPAYPPRGKLDSSYWTEGLSMALWDGRQVTWNAIEEEIGAAPFFNEIRELSESDLFKRDVAFKKDMTDKLWRMLEAMAKNSELREKLFDMATITTSCVDGGAQLFNAMGVEVLIHEAYELASPSLVEAELVTLARGKSRLDELGRIARDEINKRLGEGEIFRHVNENGVVIGTIDEVEVHLAFTTYLADQLDLPWQSRAMHFPNMSEVDLTMRESAMKRVLELEEKDLLRDSISEQPFWASYIEDAYGSEFDVLKRRINATTEYCEALRELATETSLSIEETARLNEQIQVLAAELGKQKSEFAAGQLMTEQQYDSDMELINTQKKSLLKTLTRQAMDRTKLEPLVTPDTEVTDLIR